MLLAFARSLLDLCFPWSCAVCKISYEGEQPLCEKCFGELRDLEDEPHCPMCAMTLPMHGSPCPYCMNKGPANLERMVRLGPYHPPLREVILQLKYQKKWTLAEELADRLIEQERAKELLQQTDVLVAVPLHWLRRMQRGYNQAEVIARRLGKLCKLKVARPVRRVRHTETQTHKHSHAARVENLRDAFVMRDAKCVAGKHVTIVDDVWTTGATMQAMARMLKTAKPASLSAVVVAAVDPRGVERAQKALNTETME